MTRRNPSACRRWVAAEFRVELLAVGQFDDHAFERHVVHLPIPGYCSPRKQAFDRGRHPEQPAIMPIACNEHQSNRQPARARQRK